MWACAISQHRSRISCVSPLFSAFLFSRFKRCKYAVLIVPSYFPPPDKQHPSNHGHTHTYAQSLSSTHTHTHTYAQSLSSTHTRTHNQTTCLDVWRKKKNPRHLFPTAQIAVRGKRSQTTAKQPSEANKHNNNTKTPKQHQPLSLALLCWLLLLHSAPFFVCRFAFSFLWGTFKPKDSIGFLLLLPLLSVFPLIDHTVYTASAMHRRNSTFHSTMQPMDLSIRCVRGKPSLYPSLHLISRSVHTNTRAHTHNTQQNTQHTTHNTQHSTPTDALLALA